MRIAPRGGEETAVLTAAFLLSALVSGCRCGGETGGVETDPEAARTDADDTGQEPTPPPRPEAGLVTFPTRDGFWLEGDWKPASRPDAPAVVLLPGPPDDREALLDLAEALSARLDVHVLRVDLRGHGGSTFKDGETVGWQQFEKQDWQDMWMDAEAALGFLERYYIHAQREQGYFAPRVAFVGESIGAAVAAYGGASGPRETGLEVRAVGLISPGAAMRGLDLWQPLTRIEPEAIFVASAGGDPLSWETAGTVVRVGKGRATGSLHPDARSHGLALLQEKPEALDALIGFLESRLAPRETEGEGEVDAGAPDAESPVLTPEG